MYRRKPKIRGCPPWLGSSRGRQALLNARRSFGKSAPLPWRLACRHSLAPLPAHPPPSAPTQAPKRNNNMSCTACTAADQYCCEHDQTVSHINRHRTFHDFTRSDSTGSDFFDITPRGLSSGLEQGRFSTHIVRTEDSK